MNKQAVLECRQVFKEYWDATAPIKVLMGVDLCVNPSEQVAIMGRSGSGKSTLLQMMGGLDLPTHGEIWMNGQNIHLLTERERERIRNQTMGFIYQMHHLLPEFTALENVAMPLLIGNESPQSALKRATDLLEQVGLKARIHHRPSELSGGERQRVAIARALVNNPSCVLADEPTGNLDDENAAHVLDIMQSVNRAHHTSLIIVTHDTALADKMDRTLVLHGGCLTPK